MLASLFCSLGFHQFMFFNTWTPPTEKFSLRVHTALCVRCGYVSMNSTHYNPDTGEPHT